MSCDYSIYHQDTDTINCELTLERFRRTTVALGISNAINTQNTELYNDIVNGLPERCLSNAIGAQLDVIGVIVGQDRNLENFGVKNWATTDALNLGVDAGLVYVEGAPIGGDLPADDFQYRQLIQAKIFRNHVKYGSIPEILQFAKILYGLNISIRKEGLSDLALIVPESTPFYIIQNLISFTDNLQTEKEYFLPIPTTGRLTKFIRRLNPPRATDRESQGSDQGRCSIEIPIGED